MDLALSVCGVEIIRLDAYVGISAAQVHSKQIEDIMWLFALLVAVPIIEIALFVEVGGAIGLWPTLLIVVLTALAGTILLRSQGIATLNSLQQSVSTGQNPMQPIAHGALILVAGVLLLTPGFFTDFFGLSLMIPAVRSFFIRIGAARLASRTVVFTQGQSENRQHATPQDDVIDGEFTSEESADQSPGNSGWTRPNG